MEFAKLVLLCLLMLLGYAVGLGEISAWVSPEIFTVGRPSGMSGISIWLLAPLAYLRDFLVPGVGVGMGLALASHFGNRPALKAWFFRKPLFLILALMAVVATIAGTYGFMVTQKGHLALTNSGNKLFLTLLQNGLDLSRHPHVIAVWFAYLASLITWFIGGVFLTVWSWKKRTHFAELVRQQEQQSSM